MPDLPDSVGSSSARTDGELVEGIKAGDEAAYSEIYRRHVVSVRSVARMILVDASRCDDVVAEVFVALWTSPEKFDPDRGTLLGFLRLKTKSLSIDTIRSEASRRRREEGARREDPPDEDHDAMLIEAETTDALRSAVEQLVPSEREAITLAFFGGLSYTAVAAALRVPEGTVKSRIRAGLLRLRTDDRCAGLLDRPSTFSLGSSQ